MRRETRCSRWTIDLDQRTTSVLKRHRAAQREELCTVGVTAPADHLVFANEIGDPLRPGSAGQSLRRLVAGVAVPLRGLGRPAVTLHLHST